MITKIMEFLRDRFPPASILLEGKGEIVSLGRLIERYLDAPDTCWHVERAARPALGKIKSIGDIGAHGRYAKVTRQRLERDRDALVAAVQQLVGTAYQV